MYNLHTITTTAPALAEISPIIHSAKSSGRELCHFSSTQQRQSNATTTNAKIRNIYIYKHIYV